MQIELTPEMKSLLYSVTRFADEHAHDVFDPEEYPEYQESYDEIMADAEKVADWLNSLPE
jgi:hypothetical protein